MVLHKSGVILKCQAFTHDVIVKKPERLFPSLVKIWKVGLPDLCQQVIRVTTNVAATLDQWLFGPV